MRAGVRVCGLSKVKPRLRTGPSANKGRNVGECGSLNPCRRKQRHSSLDRTLSFRTLARLHQRWDSLKKVIILGFHWQDKKKKVHFRKQAIELEKLENGSEVTGSTSSTLLFVHIFSPAFYFCEYIMLW